MTDLGAVDPGAGLVVDGEDRGRGQGVTGKTWGDQECQDYHRWLTSGHWKQVNRKLIKSDTESYKFLILLNTECVSQ